MQVIAWREKTKAFAVHFLVTLAFSASAAALVFLIWYPSPFAVMLGGAKLFLILLMCDLGLGPLSSFVIYNSKKSRRELLFDYSVIGSIQLAAFLYGMYTVAVSRPVYVAFIKDRLEVVVARDLDDADLARGAEGFRQRPKWGPKFVAIQEPTDPKERNKVLDSAFMGKDYPMYPAYYVPYERSLQQIKERALPVSDLEKSHPQSAPLLASAAAELKIPVEKLLWLPVKHRKGFWTALLDADTGRPVDWLPVDPY
jgi:hypothetical protein